MPSMATVKSAVKMKTKKVSKAAPKKAASALTRRAPELSEAGTKLVKAVSSSSSIRRAVNSTQKAVKAHPVALGTLLGAGVLVGVAARAMRGSKSPMSDAVDAISNGVSRASKEARKSFKKATSNVRRALK